MNPLLLALFGSLAFHSATAGPAPFSSNSISELILRRLDTLNFVTPFSLNTWSSASALVLSGQDLETSVMTSTSHPIVRALERARDASLPVIFTDMSGAQKTWAFGILKSPIRHVSASDPKSEPMASTFLLVDTFKDEHAAVHYRMIHLPGTVSKPQFTRRDGQMVFSAPDDETPQGFDCRITSPNATSMDSFPCEVRTDAKALSATMASSGVLSDLVQDVREYLTQCGGQDGGEVGMTTTACQTYMASNFKGIEAAGLTQMIPESGAVWRELIETTYRTWTTEWGKPFPFEQVQEISHRLNTYWYLYLQAKPFSQLYYAFVLVDAIHNPRAQLDRDDAVGFYFSNLKLQIVAQDSTGKSNPNSIFWVKSSPSTQNTKHEVGRSYSSTDSYSFSMNLGFEGKNVKGGMNFNYTKSFTASYSESREITDWSVVEDTDPASSTGQWHYFQQWPVDMLVNRADNFPQNWEQYYERPWGPCKVRDVPNLSRFALTTHDSMGAFSLCLLCLIHE
jgi:hypothetical protein